MEILNYKIWESSNQSCEKIAQILHTYAEASPVSVEVTPVEVDKNRWTFRVFTDIPSDNTSGHKNFNVVVCQPLSDSYVEILSDDRKVSKVTLEAQTDHNIEIILKNFIEIVELYDDPIIQHIISDHKNITSPDQIRKMLRTT
jgi:hypothetical protein